MKKLMVTAVFLVLGFAFTTNAQEQPKTEKSEFKPGWYVMANGGASWILAEGNDFIRNNSSAYFSLLNNAGLIAKLGAGYDFTSVYGVRANVGYMATNWPDWRNNFDFKSFDAYYLNADFIMNLSNLIKGYNTERRMDYSAFAGLGGGMRNKGDLRSSWLNLVGRIGAQADYKITPQLALNLIGDLTIAGDNYNDYLGGRPVDLLPALSLGLTYRFAGDAKKTSPVTEEPVIEPTVQPDTVITPEKPLVAVIDSVKKIETPVVPVVTPEIKVPVALAAVIHENIFYSINKSKISNATQQASVNNLVKYLTENPDAKIVVSGYADKATGSTAINRILSKKRAINVANTLIKKYGFNQDRILVKWYGSDVQPYKQVVKNRVVIVKSVNEENSDQSKVNETTPQANDNLANQTQTVQQVGYKSDVFFPLDKAEVNSKKQTEVIAKAADYLKQNPTAKITLSGYANKKSGTEDYNKEISKKRAVNVANALIQKYGIPYSRIQVKWFGAGVQPYMTPAMNQLVIMKAE